MSILASQTLGGVTFITISEPYPLFSAATNYIALNPQGRMFFNVPYSSMWFPIDDSKYSEMQDFERTGTTTYTVANNGTYAFAESSLFNPTATTLNGFTVRPTPGATAITLSANSDNTARYVANCLISTFVFNVATYDQMPYEIMPTLNNSTFIPVIEAATGKTWGAGHDCAPDIALGAATQYATKVYDIDGNVGDFAKIASRIYNDGITNYGTYGVKNYKLSLNLVEESTVLFFENFETGVLNNWRLANENQTNKWIIGTGTSYDGSYSLYISSGSTLVGNNLYNATATSVSHVFTDVKFPLGNQSVGRTPYYLSFRYRSLGNLTDFGKVFLTETSFTPTGGTQVSETKRLGTTIYSGASAYTASKIVFSGLATSNSTTNYLNETWETGFISGDTGGWAVINDTTNKWTVASGTSSGGTYSAYITTSVTGTTTAINSYNVNVGQVSHLFRTISIPSSATSATLVFNWKCQGENGAAATSYDYGTVVISDTGTTPTAGIELSTTKAVAGGNGRIGGDATFGKFNLNYIAGTQWNTETINMTSYIGLNKRLNFSWANDASLGAQPPLAIDNIVLSYNSTTEPTKDSDGYVTQRIIFSWVNDATTANNPPLSIDNVKVYTYPAVPNDKS